MNKKIVLGALALALAGASSVWAAPPFTCSPNNCPTPNNANKLKGNFAQLLSGFANGAANPPVNTSNAFPEASTGIVSADGAGTFKANLVFNAGGFTCSGTVAGCYCVNNDGTGTETGTFTPNGTAPFGIPSGNYSCPTGTGKEDSAFTIVSPNRVDFISTNSDTVLSGSALRQSDGSGKGKGKDDDD